MKYCAHCGAELLDEAVVCPKCGCWTNDNNKVAEVSRPKLSKLALTGFILSLVSVVTSLFFLSINSLESVFLFGSVTVAVAGFVCSLVGLIKLKRNNQRGKGFAIAGLTVGAVVGVFWVLLILLAIYLVIFVYFFLFIILLAL